MTNGRFTLVAFVGMSLLSTFGAAQEAVPRTADLRMSDGLATPLDGDIQAFRKDLRSAKKQLIAANLNLTDAEAERFWPVYDRFTNELIKISDTKVALIKDYVLYNGALSDDQADRYLEARAAAEDAAMKLRLKYIPIFRKALSAKTTAQFFQMEWQITLLVDLQTASQIPLVEP